MELVGNLPTLSCEHESNLSPTRPVARVQKKMVCLAHSDRATFSTGRAIHPAGPSAEGAREEELTAKAALP